MTISPLQLRAPGEPVARRMLAAHSTLWTQKAIRLSKSADARGDAAPACFGPGVPEERAFKHHARLPSKHGALDSGGADRVRTDDLRLAKPALSQLSYSPDPMTPEDSLGWSVVGLGRFELPTSRLSGGRSNQLSYRPALRIWPPGSSRLPCRCAADARVEIERPISGLRKRNSVRRRQRAIDRKSPD